MSRNSQQLARLALPLLKLARQKLGVAGVVGLLIAAVLYVVVLQPLAQRTLGVTLPTIGDVVSAESTDRQGGDPQRGGSQRADQPSQRTAGKPAAPDLAKDLSSVLTETGRDTYRSRAGLRYTRGSQHGTRLAHVMAHARDDPDRVGQHGVFDPGDPAAVIRLIDEAYEQALTGRDTRTEREGERTVYTIDLGRRVGYIGGQSGNRRGQPAADHVRIVVQGDRLITAFPVRL